MEREAQHSSYWTLAQQKPWRKRTINRVQRQWATLLRTPSLFVCWYLLRVSQQCLCLQETASGRNSQAENQDVIENKFPTLELGRILQICCLKVFDLWVCRSNLGAVGPWPPIEPDQFYSHAFYSGELQELWGVISLWNNLTWKEIELSCIWCANLPLPVSVMLGKLLLELYEFAHLGSGHNITCLL